MSDYLAIRKNEQEPYFDRITPLNKIKSDSLKPLKGEKKHVYDEKCTICQTEFKLTVESEEVKKGTVQKVKTLVECEFEWKTNITTEKNVPLSKAAIANCGHFFCVECIEKNYIQNKKTGHLCPECRSELDIKKTLSWKNTMYLVAQEVALFSLETFQVLFPVILYFSFLGCLKGYDKTFELLYPKAKDIVVPPNSMLLV